MPAHLKAFLFLIPLILAGFAFLRWALVPGLTTEEELRHRRRMWLVMTAVAFLSGNFWVYAVLCLLVARYYTLREQNPLSVYVLLLFAVPPFSRVMPGLGALESIVPIFHERLLTLAILCPLALVLRSRRHLRPRGPRAPDIAVAMFLAYQIARAVWQLPPEAFVRSSIYAVLDVGIVYYVVSRAMLSMDVSRQVMVAFVTAMALMAIVAIFETFKVWLVYETLSAPFGTRGTAYHTRGALGLLRARAAVGHPIALGYNLAIALMLLYSFAGRVTSQRRLLLLGGLLVSGMLMTLSRGPWVGAAAGVLYLLLSGPGKARRISYALVIGGISVGVLSMTPFGRSLYALLPFVGTADSGSIVYRQQLWDVSMVVVRQNPWFGDLYYRVNPLMEVMRQGEGIIDIVNSYLNIVLAYGLVGLALFANCFLAAWRSARPPAEGTTPAQEEHRRLGYVLRAVLVTILVTIATVSSIALIPVVYWMMIGFCAGYARLAPRAEVIAAADEPAAAPGQACPALVVPGSAQAPVAAWPPPETGGPASSA